MADHLDDSAPQRKRIAVAEWINASSSGSNWAANSVGDARVFASRTPVGSGMSYAQDLPTLGSSDVLGSYRSGSSYSYTPASKTYYPAMHAYSGGYPEDFEFGIGVPPSSVMSSEPVGMLQGQWSSGARGKQPSFSSMYLDTDGGYNNYSGTSLLHRPPHSASSDSPNFSFSNVAASLPLASTPGPDRLLPNPTGRSSTLPYPGTLKPPAPPSTSSTATLADVASAANYAGGFDTPGLPYSSAGSSNLSSHPSSTSRSNSDTYSTSEGTFLEQERSIQSQGPAFDMHNYTASPRRDSAAGGSGGSSHGGYVPGESAHEATAHPSSHHHLSATTYMSDGPSSPISHRHGQHSSAAGGGNVSHSGHDEGRPVAVASRH
ncbi:hypothetical protein N0V88_002616 [Collariella sp. IMI 366227]|nr:hypothetical protein N0V88_002616 [Collariella sp. IMI 366227]